MNHKLVDVLIYIHKGADAGLVASVARQLARMSGVIMASVNPRVKRLISVKYDPDQLSGASVLQDIQKNGCTASLIGM